MVAFLPLLVYRVAHSSSAAWDSKMRDSKMRKKSICESRGNGVLMVCIRGVKHKALSLTPGCSAVLSGPLGYWQATGSWVCGHGKWPAAESRALRPQ